MPRPLISFMDSEVISAFSITVGGLLLYQFVFWILKQRSRNAERYLARLLQEEIHLPGLLLMLFITLRVGLQIIHHRLPETINDWLLHAIAIGIIGCVAWLFMRVINLFRGLVMHRYKKENPHGYSQRKAETRFQLIQHLLNFMIILAGIAAALMTFPAVRQVGSTILASAGVIGIVLGFAAQKSLGTLFAGIQIAIAQPIRLNDVVIVEGQYGTIGEISLTYVVVNSWDGRRLIVPINYFLEKTFENWTRVSPEVIGVVKLYTDYSLPVQTVREKVKGWLGESTLWDKRAWGFVVTDATEKAIQVRITASAKDSGDAFDLQCLLREKLITYLQQEFPGTLPRARVEVIGKETTEMPSSNDKSLQKS